MRNTFTILAITVFTGIILFSCKDDGSGPNDLGIDARELMPLKVGNYWIYETVLFDSTGAQPVETSIDSFIVTRSVNIDGIDGYEIKIFRNGIIKDTAYFRANGSTILVYGIGLKPVFHFTSSDCEYLYNKKWTKLFSASKKPWYYNEISDTLLQETYVYNENDHSPEIVWFQTDMETFFTVTLSQLNSLIFEGKKTEAFKMMFTGQTQLKIVSKDTIRFIPSGENKCIYRDNYRTIIYDDLEFNIIFGKNIGIINTTEIHTHCLGKDLKRERKLLRYKLL